MDGKKYELIVCIVNSGFNEVVMNAARECGAKGGTVINARGTANDEIASKFNYAITPEKEIVLLVVPIEIKDDVLHGLYKDAGFNTQAQGVIFTVPVDETVGIGKKSAKNEKGEEVDYKEYVKIVEEKRKQEKEEKESNSDSSKTEEESQ